MLTVRLRGRLFCALVVLGQNPCARPLAVVVTVHHPFGRRTDDGAADRADSRTNGSTGQADDAAGDRARGRRATRGGVGLLVEDGALDVRIQFRLVVVVSVHARRTCTDRAAAYRLHLAAGMTLESSNPVESAAAAGLRYVNDEGPGIRRQRRGTAFSYYGPDGQPIRDRRVTKRIQE